MDYCCGYYLFKNWIVWVKNLVVVKFGSFYLSGYLICVWS